MVAGDTEQPATVIVTVYTPELAAVADGIVGFCNVDVNPAGPLHAYVAPGTTPGKQLKFNAVPEQSGPLLLAVIAGTIVCKTTTVSVLLSALPHPDVPVILA